MDADLRRRMLEKQATDTRVDPRSYVGPYESVALVLRVVPAPPVLLRPIRDGHFTTGQGFVTFLNPGADGRMLHLASRRRRHKRTG